MSLGEYDSMFICIISWKAENVKTLRFHALFNKNVSYRCMCACKYVFCLIIWLTTYVIWKANSLRLLVLDVCLYVRIYVCIDR